MILAALPFVRYVQLLAGDSRPIFADSQIRAFLWVVRRGHADARGLPRRLNGGRSPKASLREALFNAVSIMNRHGLMRASTTSSGAPSRWS